MLDPLTTLRDLVALPSVNPMGREVDERIHYEHRVTDYLQACFERLGVAWRRQTVDPLRDNIWARLEGQRGDGRLLLFEAHQDTVPIDDMTIPPFDPIERDGRLYGRGSCDVKGGLSAMLAAFARLAELPAGERPTLVLASTVNEEHGFSGAKALRAAWTSGDDPLLPRPPDAVVVGEPTKLDVVVAHKGAVRWRCHTLGRAGHSSQPERGENAIYHMGPVLAALAEYQKHEMPTRWQHPLCGGPTLSVGTIRGGLSVNTIPDRCTIEIDRRLTPGEDPRAAFEDVVGYLSSRDFPFQIVHDAPLMQSRGLSDDRNGPLAEALGRVASQVASRGQRIGVPFGTNATAFAADGIPCVVFGPGDIAQAHTADEWIDLQELRTAADVLYEFALSAW